MKRVLAFIQENSNEYLLLDGSIPTLTLGLVKEELILYNIPSTGFKNIIDAFNTFADKVINVDSLISELSGGQKLILSSVIALNSSAEKIKFRNFFNSLNETKRPLIKMLIEEKIKEGKTIVIIDE
ncbi:MAG: hypothetical protein NTZ69_04105 [Bacteroidia bacterium]|nr:hypothetical protein [Bacteroidia bacterium]